MADIFKRIFLNENISISIKNSFKGPIKKYSIIGSDNQAPSYYPNPWWLSYWRIYASPGLNELII